MHGPRLNRYAHHWAFYLGHHWGYRREQGEPQLTFNYARAFSDFITNFTFSRGVTFRTPLETSAVLPSILSRVWEVDNDKASLLWEMGNQGGVSGDCFVKVAYEEAHTEPAAPTPGVTQRYIPGKVRILCLNSAFCFPEWYPHDRGRLLRFKLKYKFWGTTAEGTRQVFTYTELLTPEFIEEYINDELVDSRPNPLGAIPVVHIPNVQVSSAPWGRSDIEDIIPLNRTYNEVATDVVDMINYHAAPVTIIIGAKSTQLERGVKKTFSLPKDASIQNLELNPAGVQTAMAFLEFLKKSMHEMTGVPEGALGDVQPISNTSGVALAIQYQPMMNVYNQKTRNYGRGIAQINSFVIQTIALKEPLELQWSGESDELKEGQLDVLDPEDPLTLQTETHWPPPLPVDVLIKLNEIQMRMGLGLESKRGALRELGEEFPDQKMLEIFRELLEDINDQSALDLIKAQYAQAVMMETGMMPTSDGPQPQQGADVTASGGPDVNTAGGGAVAPSPATAPISMPPEQQQLLSQLVSRAYGTKLAQRRNPNND